MKKYNSYRDSGMKWLGEIPSNWKVLHAKRCAENITDGAHTSPDTSSKDYPFLSVVILKNNELDFNNCLFTSKKDYEQLLTNGCQPEIDDILFSKDGTIGETHLVTEKREFVVGSSFIIISPNQKIVTPKFFKHFVSSSIINQLARIFVKGTGIPRLSIYNFARLPIILPTLEEQIKIAKQLDVKTQAIDNKINLFKKKSEYYLELRGNLITETINKGLNKNIRLKDSGIDWIEKIPKSWQIKRLKDYADLSTGNSISDKSAFEIPIEANPYVSTKDIDFLTGQITYANGLYIPISDKSFKRAKVFSTLVCIEGASAGKKIGFTSKETCYVNKLCCIKSKSQLIEDKYIFYFVQSNLFKSQFFSLINGLIGGVSIGLIKQFDILIPSKNEQIEITNYLSSKCSKIDKITTNIQSQITTLKELRKTLINDVVTGKIKVTN